MIRGSFQEIFEFDALPIARPSTFKTLSLCFPIGNRLGGIDPPLSDETGKTALSSVGRGLQNRSCCGIEAKAAGVGDRDHMPGWINARCQGTVHIAIVKISMSGSTAMAILQLDQEDPITARSASVT